MARWLLRAALLGSLAACAGPPPPPPLPPTVVELTLTATADANPTESGQGAPVVVRIYQLGSATNFSNAEFFQLFNGDSEFLKSDLVKRDDFILAPGQTKTATLTPSDAVKALGVFAAYRDFQRATWCGTADIPPHQTTRVTVTAGASGITVKAEQVPPPPPAKTGS